MREPTIAWWPGKIQAGTTRDAAVSEIDVLPTLIKLSGGKVPALPKIDGVDLWPLLSGKTEESPNDVVFYYQGGRLDAVRCGSWKMAIAPQSVNLVSARNKESVPATLAKPRLYNLTDDIGELKDIASEHPVELDKLRSFIKKMDADLGVDRQGPGIRPPGHVENPKPMMRQLLKSEYD
jgi:arylsulfatase A-like enzyme